jgi:predicted nucleotide-binding protein
MPIKRKPTLFVGSSTEGLKVAYAIQTNLDYDADVTVWPQGIFKPSRSTIEDLVDAVQAMDFGVFVFTPDDTAIIRRKAKKVARDNVLFELGLFVGHLGRERCFMVVPRNKIDMATDLVGFTSLGYDEGRFKREDEAALGVACNQIRKQLSRLGPRRRGQLDKLTIEKLAALPGGKIQILFPPKVKTVPARSGSPRVPRKLRKVKLSRQYQLRRWR